MNTSRIIWAFILCFSLAACGGGDHEEDEVAAKRGVNPPNCTEQPATCR